MIKLPADKKYGIYIHIPFCKAKCKYCSFVSTPDFSLQNPYVAALIDEIRSCGTKEQTVDTVYIGGGTPSCLYEGAIAEILTAVKDSFDVSHNAEITVEFNPESTTERFVEECKSVGVNRASMGMQSSCDSVLKTIGRLHDFDGYLLAVKLLKNAFDNISSDLILGLPGQDGSDIIKSIETLSEYCEHISVYALSVEQGTPLFDAKYLPDDDFVADLYDLACELLYKHGYFRYETSNFARKGRESKHNVKYWECTPYHGFGVAAHGYDGLYTRYKHADNIKDYICSRARQIIPLSNKDVYNEYVMLRLRTEQGINADEFSGRFGYSIYDVKKTEIERLVSDGYIIEDKDGIRIAPRYMFVMNGIIESLMLD